MKYFHILTVIGAIIGGFTLLDATISAKSAPQQAAGAAMAVGWVVIPYCFARALEIMGSDNRSQLRAVLDVHTKLLAEMANTAGSPRPEGQPYRCPRCKAVLASASVTTCPGCGVSFVPPTS